MLAKVEDKNARLRHGPGNRLDAADVLDRWGHLRDETGRAGLGFHRLRPFAVVKSGQHPTGWLQPRIPQFSGINIRTQGWPEADLPPGFRSKEMGLSRAIHPLHFGQKFRRSEDETASPHNSLAIPAVRHFDGHDILSRAQIFCHV